MGLGWPLVSNLFGKVDKPLVGELVDSVKKKSVVSKKSEYKHAYVTKEPVKAIKPHHLHGFHAVANDYSRLSRHRSSTGPAVREYNSNATATALPKDSSVVTMRTNAAFLRMGTNRAIRTGQTKEYLNKILESAKTELSRLKNDQANEKKEPRSGYYNSRIESINKDIARLENTIKTYDSQAFKDNAKTLIQQSMNNEITSSTSDDFINDNITPEMLKYTTAEQKSHMLKTLMDGSIDKDDITSMLNILTSAKSKSEMESVLKNSGGTNIVLSALGDRRGELIKSLKDGGKDGNEILLSIIKNMDKEGPDKHPWGQVIHATIKHALYKNPELLKNASPEDKAMLLDKLMDGKTKGDAENSMLEILKSIPSKAIMLQVLELAGGYDRVMDELEEKKYNLYEGLS